MFLLPLRCFRCWCLDGVATALLGSILGAHGPSGLAPMQMECIVYTRVCLRASYRAASDRTVTKTVPFQ